MAIALVQSSIYSFTAGDTGSGISHAEAFGSNVTAGSLLIVSAVGYSASTAVITTPTDTLGNTYSPITAAQSLVAGDAAVRSYYTYSTSGANTITVGFTVSVTAPTIIISEWSGSTSTPLDKTNTATGTGTTFSAGATGVLTQPDEVIYAFVADEAGNTSLTEDAADGFTLLREEQDGANGFNSGAQYKIVAATTDTTPNWTCGFSVDYAGHVGTFMAETWVPETDADELIRVVTGSRW